MVSRLYVPEPFYVIRGVPQGSVLGPVSFTLTNYDVHFYAGDIVLYCIVVMIVWKTGNYS